jgi:hypothetical protein
VKHGSDVNACLCPVGPYLITQRTCEGAVNIYRSCVQGIARVGTAAYNAASQKDARKGEVDPVQGIYDSHLAGQRSESAYREGICSWVPG